MDKKIIIVIVCVITVLILGLTVTTQRLHSLEEKYEVAMANIKAYDSQLSSEKEQNAAFQLSIKQLNYFNDSILAALNDTRKELKIKDKNLKALQDVQSTFHRVDTLRFHDTLFVNPSLSLDTLLGDKWYSLKLGLYYPSTIAVDPKFTSDKHIVISNRKETIEPPKKFFLLRWFQKKHIILNVDVIEQNPYVENETSKYIEIIK